MVVGTNRNSGAACLCGPPHCGRGVRQMSRSWAASQTCWTWGRQPLLTGGSAAAHVLDTTATHHSVATTNTPSVSIVHSKCYYHTNKRKENNQLNKE